MPCPAFFSLNQYIACSIFQMIPLHHLQELSQRERESSTPPVSRHVPSGEHWQFVSQFQACPSLKDTATQDAQGQLGDQRLDQRSNQLLL